MLYSFELASIITLFLSSVAYGMNIISFVACIGAILLVEGQLRPTHTIRWIMLCAALAMFSISTIDAVVVVHLSYSMFVKKDTRAELTSSGIFEWWSIVSFICFVVQTWIGDVILIYRCFIVWNRRYAIILPSLFTSVSGTAFGVAAAVIGCTSSRTLQTNRARNLTALIVTMYACTMTTNFITSSLIVSRIWNVKKGTSQYRTYKQHHDPLSRAIRVTVEAGLIYSISLVALLITYLVHHTSQIPVSRIIVQIIGITFNLVIVQSERRYDQPHDSSSEKRTPPPMMITKEVVVSRDPPESTDHSSSHGDHDKAEDVRISWA